MVTATRNGISASRNQVQEMRDELARLRAENAELRRNNRELRLMIDAHLARRAASPLYGPVEMTAGTCIGPRRPRRTS